jgi:site-specific recombinase XerD
MLKDDPGNYLVLFVEPFRVRLREGRYSHQTIAEYCATVFHFGEWLQAEGVAHRDFNEAHIRTFLRGHIPNCRCARHIRGRPNHILSALNHLLRLMRDLGATDRPSLDAVDLEVDGFDRALQDIWGLAATTRSQHRMALRRLLRRISAAEVMSSVSVDADMVRNFVLAGAQSLDTIRNRSGFIRCYLRYRKMQGDDVTGLSRAIPRRTAMIDQPLPQALTPAELAELLGAFDTTLPGQKRSYAIARCLADIGMRSSEVARLSLDDVDWAQGVIHIVRGKGRRVEGLPLPRATGEALVDYIRNERPQTDCRMIFVRLKPPVGLPVGRRVVQRAIHDAYARLGWNRSRVHILRHTLATHLIGAGAPVPQVADVLRHRDITTTSIYARVDANHLSRVAMPWPGSVD